MNKKSIESTRGFQKVRGFFGAIIAASLLLQLFGCAVQEEHSAASDIVNAPQNAGSVKEVEISEYAITDVSQPDGNGYYTCDYNGVQRKFILYIPEGTGENAPLIFMLHGYSDTSKNFMDYTGMNNAAERYGFAAVYPQGIHWGTSGACWNSGPTKYGNNIVGNDDIGFLVALAKYLQQTYGFSSSETFAAGFSNGAYMMYKLACDAPDTFRAVASVAGSMSKGLWDKRNASVPVGILQINGTKDNAVPIDSSLSASGGYGGAPAIGMAIEYWGSVDKLDESKEVRLSDKAMAYQYSSRENDDLVWYIEIEGFGHEWPQQETAGFSASEVILRFFSNYIE